MPALLGEEGEECGITLLISSGSCPFREPPSLPGSHSRTNQAGIFSLALCWTLTALSVKFSRSTFSHCVSWIRGWPTPWRWWCCFLFSSGVNSTEHFIHLIVNRSILFFIWIPFPGIPHPSSQIRLCPATQTLILNNSCPSGSANWCPEVSNLPCSPPCPSAHRWKSHGQPNIHLQPRLFLQLLARVPACPH